MNVLSLFDGISCGQIALEKSNIIINKYYSSEIDKNAIKVTQKNYPNTIQLGDITNWEKWKINSEIDLLIGGSPCQGFSYAGKVLNFDDPRSKLFFEYVKVLNKIKPKYFLLENVKMKQESQDIISDYLKVKPIEINSSVVSAQNRVRLYWTNIPNINNPLDKHINLTDILESKEMVNPSAIRGRCFNGVNIQCLEVRSNYSNKSNCLTTVDKDNVLTSLPYGKYFDALNNNIPYRYYTPTEYERLQTIPDGYTKCVSDYKRKKLIGNSWTVDVIAHIFKGLIE